jgi:hypothetical protein
VSLFLSFSCCEQLVSTSILLQDLVASIPSHLLAISLLHSIQVVDEETRHLAKGISMASDEDDYGDMEEGTKVFSKDWLPEKKSNK